MLKRAVIVVWALIIGESIWLHAHFRELSAASDSVPSQEAVGPLNATTTPPAPADNMPQLGQASHLDESACALPTTTAVTTAAPEIYHWTDAEGRKHFGDRPPAGSNASAWQSEALARPEYFNLTIENRGQIDAPQFRNQLTPQVHGIYEALGQILGHDLLRKVDLNMALYPDRHSYLAYAQSVTNRDMGSTRGFYSTGINEAVTYVQDSFDETLEVARHESTHVIVAGVLGRVPVWLNEGLAEYFSYLSIAGLGKKVSVDAPALAFAQRSVAQGYPKNLAALLALDSTEWRGAAQDKHYAVSWALVYFLMSSDSGKAAIVNVMQQLARNYCRPVDSTAVLAASYSGGIDQLQRDFYQWLGDGASKGPHYY